MGPNMAEGNSNLTWGEAPEQAARRLLQILHLGEGVHGSDDHAVAASASRHQHLHVAAWKRPGTQGQTLPLAQIWSF